MMHSKLKWLILIQLLLNEQALCRAPPPLAMKNTLLPSTTAREAGGMAKQGQQSLLGSQTQLGLQSEEKGNPKYMAAQKDDRVQSASLMVSNLRAKLVAQMQDYVHIHGNVNCEDLMSATTIGEPSSSLFPKGLLGLSLVPVLAVAGCQNEAQTLVLELYDLLGVSDAQELLMEVEGLIERRITHPTATAAPISRMLPAERVQTDHHLEAVIFNIQQLAAAGEDKMGQETSEDGLQIELCDSWTRLNGTMLMGKAVEGGDLDEAVRACESLGYRCAGVAHGGLGKPGRYRVVLKKGSRIMPSETSESECWILQCNMEVEESPHAAAGRRAKRNSHRNCINRREERVYNVVEWIPAVSTLYNLGTAVYYASVNCSETAKERAILSAVDFGTDALMAVTGGAAGVAGYALGAGVKTGVKAGIKYLLSSMKQEEDLMVNQYSWEEGYITIE
ncbi:uncharacterized protein apof [Lampris incognitus]|uniref:uncharacterized protein apof n=1 Tax=Lampris incognitus TaxID=2546036 RepID=UPI0024B499A2|nr:uncharacterized protein apof [Lampris incognitus]